MTGRWRRRVGALLLLLSGWALAGCTPLGLLNSLVPESGYRATPGIAYGEGPRRQLDVYAPVDPPDGLRPVVVFFYGGSWQDGARGDYRFVAEALTRRGLVVVIPDYRLHPDIDFPAFVEDGAAAVRWVRDNVASMGGDPDRLFLMGHSAGTLIAALLALDGRYLAEAGVPRQAVAGLIGLAGPYAFNPLATASVRPVFAGLADKDRARAVTFVDAGDPPMLLLHGTADETVVPRNSTLLAEAARAAGVDVRLQMLPGVGHVGILLALARPLSRDPAVIDATVAFTTANPGRSADLAGSGAPPL